MLAAGAWLGVCGCTRDNPAFDPTHETAVADAPETGVAESGEESSGDGDGDGEPGCEPPLSSCDGLCVDLDSDPENCGECGQKCFGTCVGGDCLNEEQRIVFVGSTLHDGNFGGLEGADAHCTELANQAGLEGSFMAWLSTAQVGPASRMVHFMGAYHLPNGELIANNWLDLTDGALAHPIDSDEFGELPPAAGICQGQEVWSNSNPDGTPLTLLDCQGWTSTNESSTSNAGQWSETMFPWSASGCVSVSCSALAAVYCFQQ